MINLGGPNMKHFNNLTPAEDERLSILAEEAAEVIQIICKIKRHGYESCKPGSTCTNREYLAEELGHLDNILRMMLDSKDIDRRLIQLSSNTKNKSIKRYLHHQDNT